MTLPRSQDLPERERLLIRNGLVLTMDSASPRRADVLIEDGVIADIGTDLRDPSATVLDATDHLVMPGFVDTHWHLWNQLLRGTVGQRRATTTSP